MARFRGSVVGTRGPATRLGNRVLETTADGWTGGVKVELYILDGVDCARVWLTGGTGDAGSSFGHVLVFKGPIGLEAREALAAEADKSTPASPAVIAGLGLTRVAQ